MCELFFLPSSQFNSRHNFLGRIDSGIFPCHISLYFFNTWNIFYPFKLELLKIICCVNQKWIARLKHRFRETRSFKKKKPKTHKIENLLGKFPFFPIPKNAFTETAIYFMKYLTKSLVKKEKRKKNKYVSSNIKNDTHIIAIWIMNWLQ